MSQVQVPAELLQKFVKFAELTSKYMTMASKTTQNQGGQLRKLAEAAPALADRAIELSLISKNQKQAAEKAFRDPAEFVKLFHNVLTKYATERAERVKMASFTLGEGEGGGDPAGGGSPSHVIGARGAPSEADDRFRMAMIGH